MSKAVLISIQPEWCEFIARGDKTIEIRKTRPKLVTPFKCYIYCTEPKKSGDIWLTRGKSPVQGNGKIIGEFLCDSIVKLPYNCDGYGLKDEADIIARSCVSEKELYHYLQGATPYGWHISDLVIYDKPKELSEFYSKCDEDCPSCEYYGYTRVNAEEFDMDCASGFYGHKLMKRPPQSWCYVEEIT